jgi:hypothetical protein
LLNIRLLKPAERCIIFGQSAETPFSNDKEENGYDSGDDRVSKDPDTDR